MYVESAVGSSAIFEPADGSTHKATIERDGPHQRLTHPRVFLTARATRPRLRSVRRRSVLAFLIEHATILHGDMSIVKQGIGTFGSLISRRWAARRCTWPAASVTKTAKFASAMWARADENDCEFQGGRVFVKGAASGSPSPRSRRSRRPGAAAPGPAGLSRRSAGPKPRHTRRQSGPRRSIGRLSGSHARGGRRGAREGTEGLAVKAADFFQDLFTVNLAPDEIIAACSSRRESRRLRQAAPARVAFRDRRRRGGDRCRSGCDPIGPRRADGREHARDSVVERGASACRQAGGGEDARGGRARGGRRH